MKTLKVLLFIVFMAIGLGINAQSKYAQICNSLTKTKLQHPYLVFDEKDKAEILKRIQNDEKLANIFEMLKKEGERYLNVAVEPELAYPDINDRYKDKGDLHATYQSFYRVGAMELALLYQLTGDTKYAEKAYYLAAKLCAMDTWTWAAHYFEIIYPRVWPYGAKDDQVVFSFDIGNGHMVYDMALVYDWLHPALTKAQRDRLRNGILEKGILRARGSYDYLWWAKAYKCNWSGINHGGLGMAALALLNEDPNLVDVLDRSVEGVEEMFNNLTPEGGWHEGRHYSMYGLSTSVGFMDAMKRVTKGKINLFEKGPLKDAPTDFLLFGLTGSFNDGGSGGPAGSPALYGRLAVEGKNSTAIYYIENYLQRPEATFGGTSCLSMNSIWDLIWKYPSDIKAVKPTEASKYFPGIEWAFLRKDFGDEYMQVATKCGPLDDPHHDHLDAGSVNLTWKGESFIGEFPQGFYDQFIFNDGRWNYLNIRSSGHNTIMVNDEEQIIAKRKDQPCKDGIGGVIKKFDSKPNYAYVIEDATKAYENKHLKGWQRTIILDKETDVVILLDKVKCAKGAKIDLLFHPNVEATVAADGKTAILSGKSASLEMKPLYNSAFTLTKQRQLYSRIVQQNDRNKWIPCLFNTIQAPAETNIIGTIFYPVEIKDATNSKQFELDESGKNPVVRYTINGKTVSYEITDNEVKAL